MTDAAIAVTSWVLILYHFAEWPRIPFVGPNRTE